MWIALSTLLSASCAGPGSGPVRTHRTQAGTAALCLPSFPYRDGWLGGDAAFSVPLPTGDVADTATTTTLWLFGDSFVGREGQPDRRGAALVHNTIGLSRCTGEGWQIDYHWRLDAQGNAVAFFDSGESQPYWWPFAGFTHDGSLYVSLLEVSTSSESNSNQLPFRLSGVKIARIDDPSAPPANWHIQTRALSHSREAFPSSASVVSGDYVYFFAFLQRPENRLPGFLARLPLRVLEAFPENLSDSLETWTESEQWQRGFLPRSARILMPESASEMSVHYDTELRRWLAVYGFPIAKSEAKGGSEVANEKGAPARARAADRVYLRGAERLTGPWSEPRSIFLIPDIQADYAGGHDPDTFCYAAKAHPEFSPPGRLLLTYVCNLWAGADEPPWQAIERLTTEMNLYRPQPVLIPLPASLR